jgi:hypothetical protein
VIQLKNILIDNYFFSLYYLSQPLGLWSFVLPGRSSGGCSSPSPLWVMVVCFFVCFWVISLVSGRKTQLKTSSWGRDRFVLCRWRWVFWPVFHLFPIFWSQIYTSPTISGRHAPPSRNHCRSLLQPLEVLVVSDIGARRVAITRQGALLLGMHVRATFHLFRPSTVVIGV